MVNNESKPGDAFFGVMCSGMKRLIERELSSAKIEIGEGIPHLCSESGDVYVLHFGWTSHRTLAEHTVGACAARWFERKFSVRLYEIF